MKTFTSDERAPARRSRHTRRGPKIRSTTVICVRRDGKVVMAGDGQVTPRHQVLKTSPKKMRRLFKDKNLTGVAGPSADALSPFSPLRSKVEEVYGNPPPPGVVVG